MKLKYSVFLILTLSCINVMESKADEVFDEVVVLGHVIDSEATLPGSGARLSTEDIRGHSYDDINEILRKVPGVYLREEDGHGLFPNISLRGVDTGRSAKVTLMEDGIPTAPAPYSAPSAYYSPTAGRMDSIEILKGSSQIKYGPHTTGGVVNYLSTPIPENQTVYFKGLLGSNEEQRLHTYVGDTVDTARGRFGYVVEEYYRRNDGFKNIDTTPDFDDAGNTGFIKTEPMVKVAWEPPQDSPRYQRVEAKFGYTDLDANESYLGLSQDDFESDPDRRYAASRFDNIDTEHWRSYLRYTTEVTDNVMASVTGYYNKFSRNWFKLHQLRSPTVNLSEALAGGGTSLSILKGEAAGTLRYRNNNRDYELWGYQGSLDFDFDLGEVNNNVEIGVGHHQDYVRRLQNNIDYTQDATGAITGISVGAPGTAGNRRQESESFTSYIRDTIQFDGWTLTPGFRHESISYEYVDFNTSGIPDQVSERGTDELTATAWGVGLAREINESVSAFTGVHQGYSVPGPRDNVRTGIKEETSLTIEAGLRYQHPQNSVTAEVVYFHTDFDDLLVPDNIGGSGSGTTENAGDVLTQGIEFKAGFDLGVIKGWKIKNPYYAAFTYTNARLDGDSNSTDAESIFAGGKDGNRVPYIPDYQLSFGTGLEVGKWAFFVDANYVGDTFTTANNTDGLVREDGTRDARFGKTDEQFTVDLSGSYALNENAKIITNLQNIGNAEYVVSRHPHGPRPGKPFTFTTGVEVVF